MEASRPDAVADPSFCGGTTSSFLLELASRDDLDGFQQAVEGCETSSCRKWMDAVGHWYCRCSAHDGASQMGMQERTPMMIAASYGSIDVLSYIVKSWEFRRGEIDVNRRSGSDGSTALHCAAAGGSQLAAEAAALLVENGADVEARDAQGRRPADVMAAAAATTFRRRRRRQQLHDELGDREEAESVFSAAAEDVTVLDGWRGGIDSDEKNRPSSSSRQTITAAATTADRPKPPKTVYPTDPSIPDIKTGIYASDEFRMFAFKVRPCSRPYSHDWTECPFVHPGENARRRDPRRYHYSCVPCPDFRKGCCQWGDACEYAHGVFECWLHPAQYRTRLCKDGAAGCKRRVCFFAHTTEELRPLFPSCAAGCSAAAAAAAGLPPPLLQQATSCNAAGSLGVDVVTAVPSLAILRPVASSSTTNKSGSHYCWTPEQQRNNGVSSSLHYYSSPPQTSANYSDRDPTTLCRAGYRSHVSNDRTGSRRGLGIGCLRTMATDYSRVASSGTISSPDNDRCRQPGFGTNIGRQMQLLLQRLKHLPTHSDLQTPADNPLFSGGSCSCNFPMYPPPSPSLMIGPDVEASVPSRPFARTAVDGCTEKDLELHLLDDIDDESLYTTARLPDVAAHRNFAGGKSYSSLGELSAGGGDWGSPVGKPEWALTDADLSKLRKSASFGVGKIGTAAVAAGLGVSCLPEEEEEEFTGSSLEAEAAGQSMSGGGGQIDKGTGGASSSAAAATGAAEGSSCCSWMTEEKMQQQNMEQLARRVTELTS